MNWREFTDLTATMEAGGADAIAAAIDRALNKQALAHTAQCWQRFSGACTTKSTGAPATRSAAPAPWLPPLP